FDRLVIYALEIALREMISELFRKYALFHHMIISICRFITFIIPKTGMPVTTCLLYLVHHVLCLLPDRYQILQPVGAVIQQNALISELFRKYALFHHMIISICRFITFIIPKTGMPVTTCLLYLLHDFLCLLPDRYQIVEPVGAVIQQNDIIFRYTECLRHLFFD